jgi:DNA-binding NarL/FixJ family response regulator
MKTVVIADDEAPLRDLLALMIGRDDRFTVVADVPDGPAALEAITVHDPDLLVLDLSLPKLDGLEVLERLTDRLRPAVVVLTGFADPDTHARAVELGAARCLVKGTGFADLLAALVEASGSGELTR